MKKVLYLIPFLLFMFCNYSYSYDYKNAQDSMGYYYSINDMQNGSRLAREIVFQNKVEFGELDSNYANAIGDLCEFYFPMRLYDSVLYYTKIRLNIQKSYNNGDDPSIAKTIFNIGMTYKSIDEFTQAEQYFKESLEMRRRLYKEDNTDLAFGLLGLGYLYNTLQDYKKAEPYLIESLEMRRRLLPKDNKDVLFSLNEMGYFYIGVGDYIKAEPYFKEGYEIKKNAKVIDSSEYATSINNLGFFYNKIGDYKNAEKYYLEAEDIRNKYTETSIREKMYGYRNLGDFYFSNNQYEKAEKYIVDSYNICNQILKNDNRDLVSAFEKMAMLAEHKKNYKFADSLYNEALLMSKRLNKDDNVLTEGMLNSLAVFYQGQKEYSKSEAYFIESMEMCKKLYKGDNPRIAKSLYYLAKFYFITGDMGKAENYYFQAMNMYSKIINNYFPSLSENEKSLFWNRYKHIFEAFKSFVTFRMKDNPQIIDKMFDNQLFTKAILYNSGKKIKKRILNSKDSTLINDYQNLSDLKEKIAVYYSLSKKELDKKKIKLDSLEELSNLLEKQVSLKSEAYKLSSEKKKVDWRTVQVTLKPDEAAIEIVRFKKMELNGEYGDSIYYAALIVSDQTEEYPEIVILENGKQIEDEFYPKYRQLVKAKLKDNSSFNNLWSKIYDKTKQYKRIFLSSDGIYNKLNISTLELPNGTFMIDNQEIQNLNSTSDLLYTFYSREEESNIFNNAVLIGNPSFKLDSTQNSKNTIKAKDKKKVKDGTNKKDTILEERAINIRSIDNLRGIDLSELPGTEIEINNIEKFLKNKKWEISKFVKNNATKNNVKLVNNPRVLHIATHGFFLPLEDSIKKDVNPLFQTGLFFAGASSHKSDADIETGYLTAFEAMNLDLDKTELVVLSACETGLGEIKNGEGVFGLRRAFQQAGAKTVIMSLWSVNDDATQELMSSFYADWLSGKTKKEAFKNAQIKMKNKYKDPYYWGAFVMVGE